MVSLWEHLRTGGGTRGQSFDMLGSGHSTELTKRNPTLSLTKQGAAAGTMRVNLSWQMRTPDLNERQRRRGSLRHPLQLLKPEPISGHTQGMVNVDLDLACMYELADGTKGVVQPLGELLGSMNEPPYIKLTGDDRFGSGSGETLYINLDHADKIKRLLVFVYVYDSTPAFERTNAVVTLVPSNGPQIEVRLTERAPEARSVAVMLIEHEKDELVVRREVRYVYGYQADLDRLYGWGMTWGRGYK
ncbi:TerD family protein [Streptomyces alkaliterrae]|uniref:Tellurium resistance n=1 Tax=Streptomyces alkaliterrae TaxID=2213162 RepID=A0A5P0YX17_9ACTN|nr:Tellurium resistance [Streptomyces alkaliterrae]MBB1255154.1 Tellurium resistance [Streptomyces alkaliterrae]MBB1261469.1 Tellurium resistance [Streptomyces alkaliterrae]MQS04137.1 Tellurium resistance [Streptomyces alkaliterrae]